MYSVIIDLDKEENTGVYNGETYKELDLSKRVIVKQVSSFVAAQDILNNKEKVIKESFVYNAKFKPYPIEPNRYCYLKEFRQNKLLDSEETCVNFYQKRAFSNIKDFKDIEVYVDGAYNKYYPNVSGGAGLFIANGELLGIMLIRIQGKLARKSKNIASELTSAYYMVEMLSCTKVPFKLYYDYQGIYNLLPREDHKPYINTDITYSYQKKMVQLGYDHIDFIKVQAHTGNTYNELADMYAKCALNPTYYKGFKFIGN